MSPAVLADTGPLYAAVDPDDQHHARAQRELQALARDGFTVLVAYPIVLEAYTLVLYRLGRSVAGRWLDQLTAGSAWLNPTAEDYGVAVVKAGAYTDQAITLFDAVTAALAARLGCPVWTYDFHFDVMSTPVWR